MRRLSFCGLLLVTAVLLAPVPAAGFNVNMNYLPGSSPAFGLDDTVLAVGADGKLNAFDSQGNKKGEYATGSTGLTSPAVGDDGSIFFGDGNGNLHAFYDINNHKWVYETGSTITTDPVIDRDGNTYFGTSDQKVHCVGADGNSKWVFEPANIGGVSSSPVIGPDGKVYVAMWDPWSDYGRIYAIDGSGNAAQIAVTGSAVTGSPGIGSDGTLYFKTEAGNVLAIGPDGKQKWVYNTGQAGSSSPPTGADGSIRSVDNAPVAVSSSPVIDVDGAIYFASGNKFFALTRNGAKKWDFTAGGDIKSTAAIGADGIIYFGSDDGWINMLNRQGALVGWFTAGGAIEGSPTLAANGMLYFGAADGKLYGLGTSSPGLARSAWPMFMHDPRHTGRAARRIALPFLNLLLGN